DDMTAEPEGAAVWIEEQTPLKEIYGTRFTVLNPTTCKIELSPIVPDGLPANITIEFQKSDHYPHSLPPHIVVLSEPKLPAHVRLSLIRQAGLYAWVTLRGTSMVWGLS